MKKNRLYFLRLTFHLSTEVPPCGTKVGLLLLTIYFSLFTFSAIAQDDMMSLLSQETAKGDDNVIATFKANRIINARTCETVKKGTLDFRVTHRFGNINSGVHNLYGFDNASNIRISLDYGLTDKLQIGIGRNKVGEQIDGSFKYRLFWQNGSNNIPFSVALFEGVAFTPEEEAILYSGADTGWVKSNKSWKHRLSYVHQLIVARKFNERFSFEVLPTYVYRNYILRSFNPTDSSQAANGIFAVGAGGRLKISKRVSVIADYFYIFSGYYRNNPGYFFPLGIGVEIETGGHVFSINFTNSSGIIENDYISNTTDSWGDWAIKFGFNISRVFTVYE